MEILETYEGASGQKVNKSKTAIFFSKSTVEATKQEIKEALGMRLLILSSTLGCLPWWVGGRRRGSIL